MLLADKISRKQYDHEYYLRNRDKFIAYNKKWAKDHPEELRARNRKYYHAQRDKILAAYGNKCTCCGETEKVFLDIDHVNGGGAAERRETNCTYRYLASIINRGFPKDYQLLCSNCNKAKRILGVCPHQSREVS